MSGSSRRRNILHNVGHISIIPFPSIAYGAVSAALPPAPAVRNTLSGASGTPPSPCRGRPPPGPADAGTPAGARAALPHRRERRHPEAAALTSSVRDRVGDNLRVEKHLRRSKRTSMPRSHIARARASSSSVDGRARAAERHQPIERAAVEIVETERAAPRLRRRCLCPKPTGRRWR